MDMHAMSKCVGHQFLARRSVLYFIALNSINRQVVFMTAFWFSSFMADHFVHEAANLDTSVKQHIVWFCG